MERFMTKIFMPSVTLILLSANTVYAGALAPVPVPVAGLTGPVGVGAAVAVYIGYRVWTRNR